MTQKTRILLPVATALLLVVGGCSGDATPAPTVTVTETAKAPEATPEAPQEDTEEKEVAQVEPPADEKPDEGKIEYKSHGESPRGNIIKHVGDWAAIQDNSGGMAVDFRVTAIEREPVCNSGFVDKPVNEQYVRVEFEVVTNPSLKEFGDFYISPHDVSAFKEDGSRVNDVVGNGYTCLTEADTLPSSMGPGEKVIGSIILDLPKDATVFRYSNYLTNGGWEWPIDSGDGA